MLFMCNLGFFRELCKTFSCANQSLSLYSSPGYNLHVKNRTSQGQGGIAHLVKEGIRSCIRLKKMALEGQSSICRSGPLPRRQICESFHQKLLSSFQKNKLVESGPDSGFYSLGQELEENIPRSVTVSDRQCSTYLQTDGSQYCERTASSFSSYSCSSESEKSKKSREEDSIVCIRDRMNKALNEVKQITSNVRSLTSEFEKLAVQSSTVTEKKCAARSEPDLTKHCDSFMILSEDCSFTEKIYQVYKRICEIQTSEETEELNLII